MAAVWVDPKKVREFEDAESFYEWLGKHWDKETELWIKIHKVGSGRKTITPKEAIDVALCWGWIDAIRKGFDEDSFLQRYTPRGKKSVWSEINVANVARLIKEKRMRPSGLVHIEAAKADGRWERAYGLTTTKAPPDLLAAIKAVPKAQKAYESLSAQNRFALTFRTLSLKTEEGRKRRISAFVEMLKKGETIHPQSTPKPAATKARK